MDQQDEVDRIRKFCVWKHHCHVLIWRCKAWVGLIFDKTTEKAIINWEPVNNRIIPARLTAKFTYVRSIYSLGRGQRWIYEQPSHQQSSSSVVRYENSNGRVQTHRRLWRQALGEINLMTTVRESCCFYVTCVLWNKMNEWMKVGALQTA